MRRNTFVNATLPIGVLIDVLGGAIQSYRVYAARGSLFAPDGRLITAIDAIICTYWITTWWTGAASKASERTRLWHLMALCTLRVVHTESMVNAGVLPEEHLFSIGASSLYVAMQVLIFQLDDRNNMLCFFFLWIASQFVIKHDDLRAKVHIAGIVAVIVGTLYLRFLRNWLESKQNTKQQ